jgi:hypothetical protein
MGRRTGKRLDVPIPLDEWIEVRLGHLHGNHELGLGQRRVGTYAALCRRDVLKT